ncbi:MAG TPA: helix-turn-helix domain-containing protein, partial [Polyangia bacterium]
FVRLPTSAVEKLDRAAETLGMRKKDLVASLVEKYVDPDSGPGRHALGTLSSSRLAAEAGEASSAMRGSYSFRSYDPPEVLNVQQAAEFLQIDAGMVTQLAEEGELPGRKLGTAWRFSRAALVAWLSKPEERP